MLGKNFRWREYCRRNIRPPFPRMYNEIIQKATKRGRSHVIQSRFKQMRQTQTDNETIRNNKTPCIYFKVKHHYYPKILGT